MIISSIRPYTEEEKQQQLKRLPGIYTRFQGFIMKLILIVFLLLIPMLVYDHFSPVASNIQAAYCIAVLLIATSATFWITNKWEGGLSNKMAIDEILSSQAEVIQVKTSRAIKREDPEDFGIAYYLDVTEKGKSKTLFLWGQYLDELEDETFPNTEFEIIRKKDSEEFIDFKLMGVYFKEEKTLPPFDKAVWQSGNYPMNGQILEEALDSIK